MLPKPDDLNFIPRNWELTPECFPQTSCYDTHVHAHMPEWGHTQIHRANKVKINGRDNIFPSTPLIISSFINIKISKGGNLLPK